MYFKSYNYQQAQLFTSSNLSYCRELYLHFLMAPKLPSLTNKMNDANHYFFRHCICLGIGVINGQVTQIDVNTVLQFCIICSNHH